jgi:urea transporter/murein DD-endopeptidase MepM/ murein hydrolase activator NlpD
MALSRLTTIASGVIEATLASYAQVLFSRHWLTGLLLLAATATEPKLLVGGLATVLLTNGLALALGMGAPSVRSGLFGINGLLVGLAVTAWFEPTPVLMAVLVLASIAVVLIAAGLRTLLASMLGLPVLSLPFVVVAYLVLMSSPALPGLEWRPFVPLEVDLSKSWLWWSALTYLRILGAIVLRPEPLAGLLVMAGLIVSSRISFVLSLVGFGLALAAQAVLAGAQWEVMLNGVGLNAVLVAIALGGYFFVTGRWSLLLAAVATLMGVLVTTGLDSLVQAYGLPVLILPFNLTVMIVLYGMRQRMANRRPVQLDLVGCSPEESLYTHQTRVARFGWSVPLRVSLPFRGSWTVTQGWNGEETHREPWSHGWDFEVSDDEGKTSRGQGSQLADYLCYKLPVLAPADGLVVAVVDGQPDNPIGEPDLVQNWGNVVVIRHLTGVCSVVAHLSPGSIKVTEGMVVRRGDQIGSCGSSGRSWVPHLHVQFQGTGILGAPTLPGEFHDLVLEGEEPRLLGSSVPEKGQRVRNLLEEHRVQAALRFPAGHRWTFEVASTPLDEARAAEDGAAVRTETIISEVTLLGDRRLRSLETGTTLIFLDSPVFLSLELVGSQASVLAALHLALSRVPLEMRAAITWTDLVPWRPHLGRVRRWLLDLASPLGRSGWLAVRYALRQEGGITEIIGRADQRDIESRARFEPIKGLVEVSAQVGAWQVHARRRDDS